MEKEIIREALGTYLRLSAAGGETVGDRMFMYQNLSGFLSMEVTWINGQKYYLYDISGKITLGKYLSDHDFGVCDVRAVCRQILKLPEILQSYLLDEEGAVIHPDYLYLDPSTKEMAAVYYPASPYPGISALGGLLEEIMDKMDQKDQELVFFVYGMHRLTKEEGTTQQTLKKYLEEKADKKGQTDILERQPERQEQGRKNVKNIGEKKESYLLPVAILLVGMLLAAALWYAGWFTKPISGEVDWPQGLGATAFFLGVAGYGAWKSWPKRECDTLWEDGEKHKKVCLIPCQGSESPIPVCHVPFLLGCDGERVDGVLPVHDMSPIHARIVQEGDGFMVMDEESAQGTFHNDERLVPWQKKKIQDGDMLRFASREYVVEIT